MTRRSIRPWLAHGAPPREPSPALRERLLTSLASLTPERVELRAGGGAWVPGEVPGVATKLLLCDVLPGRRTALGRLSPGAVYPGHLHGGSEELYVLDGELVVQGRPMAAGDFCAAVTGTVHQAVRSPSGALFVMAFSEQDRPCGDPATEQPGLSFEMAAEARWLPLPGGAKRALFRDAAAGTETAVLRLEPRGSVAAGAATQLFVLSGEGEADGAALAPGDFRFSAAAPRLSTQSGCTLLLIDSAPLVA